MEQNNNQNISIIDHEERDTDVVSVFSGSNTQMNNLSLKETLFNFFSTFWHNIKNIKVTYAVKKIRNQTIPMSEYSFFNNQESNNFSENETLPLFDQIKRFINSSFKLSFTITCINLVNFIIGLKLFNDIFKEYDHTNSFLIIFVSIYFLIIFIKLFYKKIKFEKIISQFYFYFFASFLFPLISYIYFISHANTFLSYLVICSNFDFMKYFFIYFVMILSIKILVNFLEIVYDKRPEIYVTEIILPILFLIYVILFFIFWSNLYLIGAVSIILSFLYTFLHSFVSIYYKDSNYLRMSSVITNLVCNCHEIYFIGFSLLVHLIHEFDDYKRINCNTFY
ncbi:hypothetical protein TUBRATIS_007670 [Tubulinosema ratisbonensis]|uniref:Uncharacterized protein n=1 Tax=Tubulinosema ratisbonensis TaxID=291195 RepID=A0A437ANW7_9MICR|nr:hypothetical protein TUBRATIS_007670 [Tubulinosema ratisbonensis]